MSSLLAREGRDGVDPFHGLPTIAEPQAELQDLGATRTEIGGFEAERGFRFAMDGQLVDVLAPDGAD